MLTKRTQVSAIVLLLWGALALLQTTAEAKELRVPQEFSTIQSAIESSQSSDVILLAAGVYLEDVRLEDRTGLTIQGAGSDKVTIIGMAIVSSARGVTLRGVTLLGGLTGLRAERSTLTLEDVRLSSSQGDGAVFADDTMATIRDSVIEAHQENGVTLANSKAFLSRVTIARNGGTGVAFERSAAAISDSQISKNAGDGILAISSSADLRNNQIRENTGCGIRGESRDGGRSAFSGLGNVIARNQDGALCGAGIPSSLATNVKRVPEDFSTIQSALNAARDEFIITIGPRVYLENLTVSRSVELQGLGPDRVTVLRLDPRKPVVTIRGAKEVWLRGLAIVGGSSGLVADGTAVVTLKEVRLTGSQGDALSISSSVSLRLEDVQISGHRGNGLTLTDTAHAIVQRTQVDENGGHGILLSRTAGLFLRDVKVNRNGGSGLRLENLAQATVSEQSEITGNVNHGIDVTTSAVLALVNSTVASNGGHGLLIAGLAEIRANVIRDNTQCGVQAVEGARVTGSANDINGNKAGELCAPDSFTWPLNFRKT